MTGARKSEGRGAADDVVYADRLFAGGVRRRPNGFEARDPDGEKIGISQTLREASAALIALGDKTQEVR